MRVLRAGLVFDGDTVRPDSELVVDDAGLIAEVRPVQPAPDEVLVVDHGADTTLLPGLIDGHQHLSWGCTSGVVDGIPADPASARAQTLAHARQALAAGITTIQDLGDSDYQVVGVRDSTRGDRSLPRLLASGPPITTPGGHCHFLLGAPTEPGDAVAAVRARVERGVDVVKVMVSGGAITAGSLPWTSQLDVALLSAVVAEAHALGVRVAGHAHGAEAVRTCRLAGVDAIEHATFMTADGIDLDPTERQALADSGIAVRVTTGTTPGTPPPPAVAQRLAALLEGMRMLVDAGATIVVSTDAGIAPNKPHDVLPFGLVQVGEVAGDSLLALRGATSRAADALGLSDTCGRLSPGLAADLLVVRGNPVADLTALHDVVAVYRDGEPVPRPGV